MPQVIEIVDNVIIGIHPCGGAMNKQPIRIGDTIHFTLKQPKHYSNSGKVAKFRYHNKQRAYEVAGSTIVIFRDEITKVERSAQR